MKIIGQQVLHKTFGSGVIIWFGGKTQNNHKYIIVEFANKKIELPFPAAFEKHITAVDLDFAEIVKQELLKLYPKEELAPQPRICKKVYHATIEQAADKSSDNVKTKTNKRLVFKKSYGSNSKKIYLDCCTWFDWNEKEKNNFGRQGALLYAKSATPEGYSPWFITHHNLSNTKGGKWKNTIIGDEIHEEWDEYDDRMWDDKTKRIVFLKLGSEYYFYGVYFVLSIEQSDNMKYTKVYKRLNISYPN